MHSPRPRAATARWIAAALLGALAHLGGGTVACGGESAAEAAGGGAAEGPPPAIVEVAEIGDGILEDHWRYLGEVRADLRAELAVGAAGEVEEVRVREGDRVEPGELLVGIDTSLATARLRALRASKRRSAAQLDQARRDAERATALGGAVLSPMDIEREQTAAEALGAEVSGLGAQTREARAALARHRVEAPFAGVIAARAVDPGDWVSAGQVVLELVATDRAEVLVAVAPSLLPYITEGDRATIDGPEGTSVAAEIVGIVRALDPRSRTARVRVAPLEGAVWLLPGAAVDVAFTVRRSGEGVLVPRDALVAGVTQTRVFRDDGDVATPVIVDVIATAGGEALVRGEGLRPGDRIVVRGNERLRPGQPLQVVESGEGER